MSNLLAKIYAELPEKEQREFAALLNGNGKASKAPKKAKSSPKKFDLPADLKRKMETLYSEIEPLETKAARLEAKARGVEAIGYVQYPSRKRFLVTKELYSKYKEKSGYRDL